MIFYLIGIDYKTVSIENIELAHRLHRKIMEYWHSISPGNAVVLATCNRVEVYGTASNIQEALRQEISFRNIFRNCFKDAYVVYDYANVFEHGLRLASGLESQLLGEPQIMQQLERWLNRDNFPILLKNMWVRIIKIAREIRADSGLDKNTVDIAKLILDDIKRNIVSKENIEIMVIGTGKIAALIAEKQLQSVHLTFAARKELSKAKKLADFSGGEALLREEIPSRLVTVDAVISATSSPHHVLNMCDFNAAMKIRRRPLYIYDVAVPRDVASDIYTIPFVRIKTLGDLTSKYYQKNINLLRRLDLAEKLVEDSVFRYKEIKNGKEDTNRYASQPACS